MFDARPGPVRLIALLIVRDLALAARSPGQWLLPMLFFLLVGLLHPFALGPEATQLRRIAPGIAWTAALLASLIPVGTLYAADRADGTLDQLGVRGVAMETLAAARLFALWLAFSVPILCALAPVLLFLGGDFTVLPRLVPALALGGAGLAALAGVAGALTVGARGGSGLVALVVLPLALPLLIFGSRPDAPGALGLLAAATLLLLAIAPFATAAALRLART
jgi:heme exporter protein B